MRQGSAERFSNQKEGEDGRHRAPTWKGALAGRLSSWQRAKDAGPSSQWSWGRAMRVCLEAGEGRGVGPLVEFLLLSFDFVNEEGWEPTAGEKV